MNIENINESINDLIALLYDSRNGYRECAEEVNKDLLKGLFLTLSDLRQKMIEELKTHAKAFSVVIDAKEEGTVLAVGHRAFIDLKSLVTAGNPDAIIEEIKRGENYTISEYKKVLSEELPLGLKEVIRNQLVKIENNLRYVETFQVA
jgi:uncharacterized protein (TIGR02284 family)